jgi:hypothetical protein
MASPYTAADLPAPLADDPHWCRRRAACRAWDLLAGPARARLLADDSREV